MPEKTSIIVLCRDRWALTQRCLASVRRHTRPGTYELLAVDNASRDGTFGKLRALARRWPELAPSRNASNVPFARAVNRAMAGARGELLLWLNNDAEAAAGWLDALKSALRARPMAAAAGPLTGRMAPPDQADPAAFGRAPVPVPFLGGFCFLLRRAALESVGPLDERFVWGWEDMDYCLRLRQAGWELLLQPGARLRHLGSATLAGMRDATRAAADRANRRLFREKWAGRGPWEAQARELLDGLPSSWPRARDTASVIVLSRGREAALRRCLKALRRARPRLPHEVLVRAVSGGWASAVNAALAQTRGELVALLDEETVPGPGWLEGLARALEAAPHAGAAAPLSPGAVLGWQRDLRRAAGRAQPVHHMGSYCLALPRAALERVGLFDERFIGREAWADYSLRLIQGGYQLVVARGVVVGWRRPAADLRPEPTDAADRRLLLDKWAGHPLFAAGARP